jgi:hypothetical protein
MKKVYLGDSVYADFDGWHIVLTTENGYPDDPRNRICIGPDEYQGLIRYVESLRAKANVPSDQGEV